MALFLVWYDPDTQRSGVEKMQHALAAYDRRFKVAPNLVLVSAAEETTLDGIEVRKTQTVQPHHYWVSRVEDRNVVSITQ